MKQTNAKEPTKPTQTGSGIINNNKAIITNFHCFTGNFPNHACQLFQIYFYDLCTINSYLSEDGCICFCLCVQTVGLVSETRPFLLCSADCFQYSYPKCDRRCRRSGKGLGAIFLKTSAVVASSFTRYKTLGLLQIHINCRDN